jgi:UDP-glucuronate decarboxylase
LANRLIQDGAKVSIYDNLSSGTLDNVKDLLDHPKFDYIIGDVVNLKSFPTKLDGIFNLACPASPVFYQKVPIQTTMTCVLGAYNLLRLADDNSCKILQTSTSEVYGDPEVTPQTEDYRGKVNCFGPRACYDEGKRTAEALFYDFHAQNKTDIRIVRIFNTYGPNMHVSDGRVVSNFIVQALRGEDITIYGAGDQTRSFCYVDDMVEALLAVWNSDIQSPVNVGNPGEFTMLELAEKVIEITKSTSKISFHPLPEDDPKQRRPDITLAKSLNWEPKIPLDKGLQSTVQYFSRLLKDEV